MLLNYIYRPIKIGSEIEVPVFELNSIFSFFEQNPSFKRKDALICFLNSYSDILLLSISTKNDSLISVVEFNDPFHDIEWIHEILSRIDLESIHEIKFNIIETGKAIGQITRGSKNKLETRSVLQSKLFANRNMERELNTIIKHLGELPEGTNNDIKDINRCMDNFASLNNYFAPVTSFHSAYDQILLWCRDEKDDFLNDTVRDNFFEKLIEEYNELQEWVTDNDHETLDEFSTAMLKSYISHAMFIANKTKRSKEIKNISKKRQKAFTIWKKHYEGKTLTERKRRNINQRKIAEEVGVSLGTLNSWFKEFKFNSQATDDNETHY